MASRSPASDALRSNVTVYYLPGTTGWGTTFAGRPVVLWNPLVQTGDASFGVRTNRFRFTITGASNLVLVVEAATNLANPAWIPVGTNTLTGGASYFSDPEWTNHPARFYRLSWQSSPPVQTNVAGMGNFGVLTNGFGFTITGPDNLIVVVEACTN